jgi:metaxin
MTDISIKPSKSKSPSSKQQPDPTWFSLPAPLRQLFDHFPLITYPANLLPQRAPTLRNENVLYIFQKTDPKSRDAPSYNPSCLKWQAYLKFNGIPLHTRPSNNHASPSGALPFLLPAATDPQRPPSPVPANRIPRWVVSQGGKEDPVHPRQDAYNALIDHNIRSAWLYYLYLDHQNFHSVAWPMYVASASSTATVQLSLAHQLQSAAREELLKTNPIIDPCHLYNKAKDSFRALSILLGNDKFFFGQSTPGLFDASLFAYTQIILDDDLAWPSTTLKLELQEYSNLVQHRDRLIRGFFRLSRDRTDSVALRP